MDRKKAAVERLRNYDAMGIAVENLQTQIRLLRLRQESIPGVRTDRVVRGGTAEPGAWLVDSIANLQELEAALEQTMLWRLVTDRALAALEPEERAILRVLYIKKSPGAVDRLCQLLEAEKSTVYRRRDKALDKLVLALYGVDNDRA